MNRNFCGTIALAFVFSTPVLAQTSAVDEIKIKIINAESTQRNFERGLKFCKELDGTNFYFQPRDRVLTLDDYHRSLESLAKMGSFNAETHKPWNDDEANKRWEQAKRDAVTHKENCTLVASLPFLRKKLDELQAQASAPK